MFLKIFLIDKWWEAVPGSCWLHEKQKWKLLQFRNTCWFCWYSKICYWISPI